MRTSGNPSPYVRRSVTEGIEVDSLDPALSSMRRTQSRDGLGLYSVTLSKRGRLGVATERTKCFVGWRDIGGSNDIDWMVSSQQWTVAFAQMNSD